MEINNYALPVIAFKSPKNPLGIGQRENPQVSAASPGKVLAEESYCGCGKFVYKFAVGAGMSIWKSLRAGHSIKVMVNREDTGVIGELLLDQYIERPKAVLGNRPTGCAVAVDFCSGGIFDSSQRGPGILPKLLGCQRIDGAVPKTVAGKLVSA